MQIRKAYIEMQFKLVTIKTSKYARWKVSFTLVIKNYPVAQQTAFRIMDTNAVRYCGSLDNDHDIRALGLVLLHATA